MKKRMIRSEMYLTQKQHDSIKEEANERGINFSEMMRKIIDHYLERENHECKINS